MSTHRIDVIEIKFERHPNADALSIVRPFGYQCVVKTADWREGQLAAYIPPDYVVPLDRPEFSWLKAVPNIIKEGATEHRVRVRKFRGVMSQGLLCPAPAGSKVGDNLIDVLGIRRYTPPDNFVTGGEVEAPPSTPLVIPVYDVEAWERYRHAFGPMAKAVFTEKIHGANGRFLWDGERFYVGSRTEWKRESELNVWWKALRQSQALQGFLQSHAGWIVYGEVYGKVQDLQYGVENGRYPIGVFDVWTGAAWLPFEDLTSGLPQGLLVPVLEVATRGASDTDEQWVAALHGIACRLAEGPSTLFPGHVREGCVIRALPEATDIEIGRVQLKKVGDGYLERA